MTKTRFFNSFFLFFLIAFLSCSSTESDNGTKQSNSDSPEEEKSTTTFESMESKTAYNETFSEKNPLMNNESFRKIAALLPITVNGVEGGPFEGWFKVTPGPKFTYVKKAYRDRKNKTRVDLSIADAGEETLQSLQLNTYWNNKKIDRKLENGYEKTTIIGSYPAYEKCQNHNCDVYFTIGDRFLIGGYTENVEVKDLYKIFETIDIDQLESFSN